MPLKGRGSLNYGTPCSRIAPPHCLLFTTTPATPPCRHDLTYLQLFTSLSKLVLELSIKSIRQQISKLSEGFFNTARYSIFYYVALAEVCALRVLAGLCLYCGYVRLVPDHDATVSRLCIKSPTYQLPCLIETAVALRVQDRAVRCQRNKMAQR